MEITNEELKQLESELEELDKSIGKSSEDYGSPKPQDKDSMFKFFREILKLPESWKVGNLKDDEIGKIRLSVRSFLRLATYAKAENLDIVEKYFMTQADIVAAPTMGRKGFMAQLFVTQIKKEQKMKSPEQRKKGWFSRRTENEEEQQ